MPGPRSEYAEEQKLLLQQLRNQNLPWPKVRKIFHDTYPLEKRSEDALRKVLSRHLSAPASPPKLPRSKENKIEFAAIHTPDDPPWHRRPSKFTTARPPLKPLVSKIPIAEIDKNLQEMEEILRVHDNKTKFSKEENPHYMAVAESTESIEI